MHISWLGGSSIRLQTKAQNEDVHVVIDPYKPKKGEFPRSLTPHIGLFTRGEEDVVTLSGSPFLLSSPGECDIKGVLISAVYGTDEKHVMFRLDSEQMSLGHLGLTDMTLTNSQLETLSGVDILCIPVGGAKVGTYSAEAAVKIINTIEPRIVIPMAYKSENDPDADPVELFLKEMNATGLKPEPKVILKQKDLPQEDMQVVVLSKE